MMRLAFSPALLGLCMALGIARCEPARTQELPKPSDANAASPSPTFSESVRMGKEMGRLEGLPEGTLASLPKVPDLPLLPRIAYRTQASPKLDSIIQAVWKKSRIKGRLGVSVFSTKHQRREAGMNDSEWFTPASNLKLVVTAAVLDTFPTNHFPLTAFEVRGNRVGRTLHGTIVAIGGGDPNFSNRFFPDALRPLKPIVDSLKRLGIDTVIGSVVTVDTFFRGPRRPTTWRHHHFNTWYGAEINSLSYQDNAFDLTVMPSAKVGAPPVVVIEPDVGYVLVSNKARTTGGKGRKIYVRQDADTTRITLTGTMGIKSGGLHMVLPVRNPAAYFRAALVKSMTQDGMPLVENPSLPPADSLPLLHRFTLSIAPLYEMVEEVNQRSQNLHAESLLRHLGAYVNHDATDTSGIRAEYRFLKKLGLDTSDFILKDGCGLSPDNRIKPGSVARMLAALEKKPYFTDYIASLATPGMDGATGRRMRPWYQSNMLRYKTGSINRVQSLSGYAFGIDGDTLAVALFINDFYGSSDKASHTLDSLFVHIAEWYNLERNAVIEAYKTMTRPEAPTRFAERLSFFSAALEGRPYFLGPTGEGRFASPDNLPQFDMSRFDCVTYVESVLGMALSRTPNEVLPNIRRLRYRGDTLAYTTRNHYFVADWLTNNSQFVRMLTLPGDTTVKRTIHKVDFFKSKGLPTPGKDPVMDLRYLPISKSIEFAQNSHLSAGIYGVAFVTDIAGLDVTHCGFLIADGKSPLRLRHASQMLGQVATMDFAEYLEKRKGKCTGIVVFEFLNP
jgi:PBP4 family serine-type D-alanyl-D-alanine carboxypeptidase